MNRSHVLWFSRIEQRILWTAGMTQNDREDTESEVLACRRLIKSAKPQTTEGALSSIVDDLGDEIWNCGTRRKLAGGVDPPERAKCRELRRCPWHAENPWGEELWNRRALTADGGDEEPWIRELEGEQRGRTRNCG